MTAGALRWSHPVALVTGMLLLCGCGASTSLEPNSLTTPAGSAQKPTRSPSTPVDSPASAPSPSSADQPISPVAPEPPPEPAPAPAQPAAPVAPDKPAPTCATGSAGWALENVSFQELSTSTLRTLGIGNEFDAVVTITVVNAANYPLASSGIRIELRVPTLRYPDAAFSAWFTDLSVAAGSHTTLTSSAGRIVTESAEVPSAWSVGSASDAGEYVLDAPHDYEYSSICGVVYPQAFAVLN